MDNNIKVINFSSVDNKQLSQIEFYIPKNNILTFNKNAEHYQANNELELINYSGAIGIPRNVAINISEQYNKMCISGIIASPAHITGCGPLDLIIKPDCDLELLVQSDEVLIVDKEPIARSSDDFPKYNYSYGKRSFINLQDEYLRNAIDKISPPKIIDTSSTYNANFENSKIYNTRDIDICIKENLINIMKFNGVTNIFRYNVEYKTAEVKKKKSNGIDALRENLDDALKKEEFEKAAKIRDEIKRREEKILNTGNKDIAEQ